MRDRMLNPRISSFAARGVALVALGCAQLALASHPESTLLAMPRAAGEALSSQWTGDLPALPETSSACVSEGSYDKHRLHIAESAGGAAQTPVRLMVNAVPSGISASSTDIRLTLVRPDGSTRNADAGHAGGQESITLLNAQPGDYELRVCGVSGALPQRYSASLTVEAEQEKSSIHYVDSSESECSAPDESQKFLARYVDATRGGGEPLIVKHPDGQLLWGSHAGTTHFYSPAAPSPNTAAFAENYTGQTYYYWSSGDYSHWNFVPRQGPGISDLAPVQGIPGSGFSDPEFAFDSAGNVFVSEINLANVAVSKSVDGGRSYGLQNAVAFTFSDRQWMEADRENELYMAAAGFGGGPFPSSNQGNLSHYLAKSTDGGITWTNPQIIDPIIGDLQIDRERGILYSLHEVAGTLSIARFPNIREEDGPFTVDVLPIADFVSMSGVQRLIDPTFDIDEEGNLYAVWYENGGGPRPQGVYYSYSTNQGERWTKAMRVDLDSLDEVWPWIAVGAPGQVAIAWLATDTESGAQLPGEAGAGSETDRLQSSPDKPWHVMVAHSSTGLGCAPDGEATTPGVDYAAFNISQATVEPVHTGTICQGGTLCQARLIDRRLGDYFGLEVAHNGTVHVAVADTRRGGAVALPLHVRQIDGPTLDKAPDPAPVTTPPRAARAAEVEAIASARGGGALNLALVLILIAGLRRKRG